MTISREMPNWYLQYETGVPHKIEIPDIPLYRVLDDKAARYPHNRAIKFILKYLPFGIVVGSTLSYAALKGASDHFAAALVQLGVRPGDRVALMLPNIPQHTIAYFGILKAGGIVVNVNTTYTPRELLHLLRDSGAETLITLTGLYARAEEIRTQTALKHSILTDVGDSLAWHWRLLAALQRRATGLRIEVAPAPDIHNFYQLLRNTRSRPPAGKHAADHLVVLQYSASTTSIPKAAMLTHRNLVANIHQVRCWLPFIAEGKEKVLGVLPFFHCYGMTVTMLTTFHMGATLIMTPDPHPIELILQIIDRERITLFPAVPDIYAAILTHPHVHEYNLRSLKGCISGGASLPIEVARRFKELTGSDLAEGYGLNESSPVALANPIRSKNWRAGSVGLPIPNAHAEIVALRPDTEGHHTPMAIGEPGELVIYGPQVMKGYWNAPEETSRAINARGGLHTGDIAHMDEDGYVYLVDRKKDLIIAAGDNIVPREVEEVLLMHPKVVEAVVAGVPNPQWGEMVKAYVVLKPGKRCTDEEIRIFCKQYLAPYKVPHQIEFRHELPKSLVGKVLRRQLIEEEIAKQQQR